MNFKNDFVCTSTCTHVLQHTYWRQRTTFLELVLISCLVLRQRLLFLAAVFCTLRASPAIPPPPAALTPGPFSRYSPSHQGCLSVCFPWFWDGTHSGCRACAAHTFTHKVISWAQQFLVIITKSSGSDQCLPDVPTVEETNTISRTHSSL